MLKNVKRLTYDMLESSEEIQGWLRQFNSGDILAAKSLLCSLEFVTRDDYSKWLLSELEKFSGHQHCAVYAVRKFDDQIKFLWQKNGCVQQRPAETQGSEDFVASILSVANKLNKNCFLDHPSLEDLRIKKVQSILLIDDSIGSGKRVADFIILMTNHPTFLSWWSYGFLKLHIISYKQSRQSIRYILNKIPGSNHGLRKFKGSDKVKFESHSLYDTRNLSYRWGENYQAILDLCDSTKKIPKFRRRGFGEVLGNLVFYHSVPNNVPGMLFWSDKRWAPLFPERALPIWMIDLLEKKNVKKAIRSKGERFKVKIPVEVLEILLNIKKGIRSEAALSRRMDCNLGLISQIVESCCKAGLISESLRLTDAGYELVRKMKAPNDFKIKPNYSLYVPESWCTGQNIIQPPEFDSF